MICFGFISKLLKLLMNMRKLRDRKSGEYAYLTRSHNPSKAARCSTGMEKANWGNRFGMDRVARSRATPVARVAEIFRMGFVWMLQRPDALLMKRPASDEGA
jgi:hypothetical protein